MMKHAQNYWNLVFNKFNVGRIDTILRRECEISIYIQQ